MRHYKCNSWGQTHVLDGVPAVLPDCFSYIVYDPNTNTVTVYPNPNALTDTDVVRAAFESALNAALATGAIVFHEYSADGINDAKKKYNRYAASTMNKEQALTRFDDYVAAGASERLFIASSFRAPAPMPERLSIKGR